MRLTEFFADDAAAIDAFVALENAVQDADAPWEYPSTTYRLEMRMRHGWDGELSRWFLAYVEDGDPVGSVIIHAGDYDNLDSCWLSISVHPDRRRRGHGRAVLELVLELCREMNRPLVGIDGWDSEATHGFAAAGGFEKKSQAISRRMTLADVPVETVQALYDEAAGRASDYELVRIKGYSPDDLLEALAESTAAINDAPLDDLEMEDEVFTADRIRCYEAAQIEGGHRFYRLIARHRESGEIGGLTVVSVDVEQPADGEQHDTSVVRAHRGHRLGLLLKADMVRWLATEEPGLRTIDTWNAESNDFMISVNERLGYLILGRDVQFQRRLETSAQPPERTLVADPGRR
ncbi:MAG: GCN5-related N-acetyltransferase [Marmoricola sp.]|nr:GCN5-related N-acetyltransferase [Marmoricola sp.]